MNFLIKQYKNTFNQKLIIIINNFFITEIKVYNKMIHQKYNKKEKEFYYEHKSKKLFSMI